MQLESVYDEIPEMETSVSILEDGGVRIQHDNIGDACCPEVIVEAVADLTQKSIDLTMRTYECGNPCLYNLSVGYTLYGVPSGDWTVHANRGDFSFSK